MAHSIDSEPDPGEDMPIKVCDLRPLQRRLMELADQARQPPPRLRN